MDQKTGIYSESAVSAVMRKGQGFLGRTHPVHRGVTGEFPEEVTPLRGPGDQKWGEPTSFEKLVVTSGACWAERMVMVLGRQQGFVLRATERL